MCEWHRKKSNLHKMLSAPELKVQVQYCNHVSSVLNFSLSDFSSETTVQVDRIYKEASTKLHYQVFVLI